MFFFLHEIEFFFFYLKNFGRIFVSFLFFLSSLTLLFLFIVNTSVVTRNSGFFTHLFSLYTMLFHLSFTLDVCVKPTSWSTLKICLLWVISQTPDVYFATFNHYITIYGDSKLKKTSRQWQEWLVGAWRFNKKTNKNFILTSKPILTNLAQMAMKLTKTSIRTLFFYISSLFSFQFSWFSLSCSKIRFNLQNTHTVVPKPPKHLSILISV